MALSIEALEAAEVKARAANPDLVAPVKIRDTLHIPNLFNPETGAYGRDVVVTRLSPAEQLKIMAEAMADPSDEDLEEMRRIGREDINIAELPKLREEAWTLVYGCEDPSFTFFQALRCMGRKDAGDVVQPILYKIKELNDRIPALVSIQEAIEEVARFPLVMRELQAAFLAGPETLRKYLQEDAETQGYVRRWATTISAAAFSLLQEQARINADAQAEATLARFVDFALEVAQARR